MVTLSSIRYALVTQCYMLHVLPFSFILLQVPNVTCKIKYNYTYRNTVNPELHVGYISVAFCMNCLPLKLQVLLLLIKAINILQTVINIQTNYPIPGNSCIASCFL